MMDFRYRQNDRILPCFLDRLTDHYPRAKKESREYRVVTLKQYRESVARDLEYLFNNLTVPDKALMKDYPQVETSVVNYGIRSMSGSWASRDTTDLIVREIRNAIFRYEPRIQRDSLKVGLYTSAENAQKSKINFEIEGELWAEPLSEKLYIKTEVDLETGECRVT